MTTLSRKAIQKLILMCILPLASAQAATGPGLPPTHARCGVVPTIFIAHTFGAESVEMVPQQPVFTLNGDVAKLSGIATLSLDCCEEDGRRKTGRNQQTDTYACTAAGVWMLISSSTVANLIEPICGPRMVNNGGIPYAEGNPGDYGTLQEDFSQVMSYSGGALQTRNGTSQSRKEISNPDLLYHTLTTSLHNYSGPKIPARIRRTDQVRNYSQTQSDEIFLSNTFLSVTQTDNSFDQADQRIGQTNNENLTTKEYSDNGSLTLVKLERNRRDLALNGAAWSEAVNLHQEHERHFADNGALSREIGKAKLLRNGSLIKDINWNLRNNATASGAVAIGANYLAFATASRVTVAATIAPPNAPAAKVMQLRTLNNFSKTFSLFAANSTELDSFVNSLIAQ